MLKQPPPAKLVCGIICPQDLIPKAEEILGGEFGAIDLGSEIIPFDFTDYYEKEMGKGLLRKWVAFETLVPQEDMRRAKLTTIQLETSLARGDGSRRVNLDPGHVTPSKLVLPTTKDYSHRIYLGEGIFAQVNLIYRRGRFHSLNWTYSDYKTDAALRFFEEVRSSLLREIGGSLLDSKGEFG